MGSIRWPSDSVSGVTKGVELIRCIDGGYPQIHEFWCLGYDRVTRKIHPTAQVEVVAGNVGEFTTNYLAENERRIQITGQISITISVTFWGIPDF